MKCRQKNRAKADNQTCRLNRDIALNVRAGNSCVRKNKCQLTWAIPKALDPGAAFGHTRSPDAGIEVDTNCQQERFIVRCRPNASNGDVVRCS
jgi:hypothetical protein